MSGSFPDSELQRLSGCLAKLLPHVQREEVGLTGGVAIQISLAASGRSVSRAAIADLDFVAIRLGAVAETVSSQSLVSHYHVPQPGVPKFMIQLVDPVSRIRIDIFPDLAGSLRDARWLTIAEHSLKVLTLESIFEHKLLTLSRASGARPVDPKHADHAKALGAVLCRKVPAVPEGVLVKDVYGGEADLACRRCELSRHPGFPLAPKRQIFGLLGWSDGQPGTRLQPTAGGEPVKATRW